MILPPGNLLGQLQRIRSEAERLRAEAAQKTVTIDAGGGMVRITLGGDLRVRHISIAPQALQDPKALEELLLVAFNKAVEGAQEMVAQLLQPLEHLFPGGVDRMVRL